MKIKRLNWLISFHCYIILAAVLIKLQTLLFIFNSTLDLGNRNADYFFGQLFIFSLVRRPTVSWVAHYWRIAAEYPFWHAQNIVPPAKTKVCTQRFTSNSSVFGSLEKRGKQNCLLLTVQFAQSSP